MKQQDYELIKEISNNTFPLVDFANDLKALKRLGKLGDFDYEAMERDLVKIAITFKAFYDESQTFEDLIKGRQDIIVTDPPFNVGYHHKTYKDNIGDEEYFGIAKERIENEIV